MAAAIGGGRTTATATGAAPKAAIATASGTVSVAVSGTEIASVVFHQHGRTTTETETEIGSGTKGATGTEGEAGRTGLGMSDATVAGPRGAVIIDDVQSCCCEVGRCPKMYNYNPWSKNVTWTRGTKEEATLQFQWK
jgi:hypothetical protein